MNAPNLKAAPPVIDGRFETLFMAITQIQTDMSGLRQALANQANSVNGFANQIGATFQEIDARLKALEPAIQPPQAVPAAPATDECCEKGSCCEAVAEQPAA